MIGKRAVIAASDAWSCETVSYGAWDSGTRTIYESPIPLWCETVQSGHPILGESHTRWMAWPGKLPRRLPAGATKMGDSDPYFGAWIEFDDEIAACRYAMN